MGGGVDGGEDSAEIEQFVAQEPPEDTIFGALPDRVWL